MVMMGILLVMMETGCGYFDETIKSYLNNAQKTLQENE